MDKVAALLAQLAQQLGTTVKYLWPRLVAYYQAQAMGQLATDVVGTILAGTAAALLWKPAAKRWNNSTEGDGLMVPVWLLIGFATAMGFHLVAHLGSYISAIMAPEGYALAQLLGRLR